MMNFLRKTALWILLLPYVTYGAGFASNQLVLMANHDRFPVMVNVVKLQGMLGDDPDAVAQEKATGMIDSVHCVMTDKTHLNFLADVFDRQDATYSIGDFFLIFGAWLMTICPFIWGFVTLDKLRKT
jgi:hypothetical protein